MCVDIYIYIYIYTLPQNHDKDGLSGPQSTIAVYAEPYTLKRIVPRYLLTHDPRNLYVKTVLSQLVLDEDHELWGGAPKCMETPDLESKVLRAPYL